jgi:hypothetical protein
MSLDIPHSRILLGLDGVPPPFKFATADHERLLQLFNSSTTSVVVDEINAALAAAKESGQWKGVWWTVPSNDTRIASILLGAIGFKLHCGDSTKALYVYALTDAPLSLPEYQVTQNSALCLVLAKNAENQWVYAQGASLVPARCTSCLSTRRPICGVPHSAREDCEWQSPHGTPRRLGSRQRGADRGRYPRGDGGNRHPR